MDMFSPSWLAVSSLVANLWLPAVSTYPSPITSETEACYVTRAAYDIGSEGTKYMLARVNICRGEIAEIITHNTIPVAYRDDLHRSSNQQFSTHIRQKGIQALHQAKYVMESNAAHIDEHCAIATASFRAANNGEDFVHDLTHDLKIPVNTLSQVDEGKLAYYSALSKPSHITSALMVVWDIGGGSMQLTQRDNQGKWHVLGSELASTSFLKMVLEEVLGKSQNDTPYPMSAKQIKQAIALVEKKFPFDKNQFENQGKPFDVVAVGSVHNAVIQPLCSWVAPTHKNYYTQADLEKVIGLFTDKSAEQMSKILELSDQTFMANQLTNVILVYAIMKKLGIQKVTTLKASNVEGLLIKGC